MTDNITITLSIPAELYRKFEQQATQSQESVERLLLNSLIHDAPTAMTVLALLNPMSDDILQRIVEQRLSNEEATRLEHLLDRGNADTLTSDEEAGRDTLLRKVGQHMLLQSAALYRLQAHEQQPHTED
jgi:hypothetical protein